MKKFMIEYTNERIVAQSGLAIVGNLLNQTNLAKKLNAYKLPYLAYHKTAQIVYIHNLPMKQNTIEQKISYFSKFSLVNLPTKAIH